MIYSAKQYRVSTAQLAELKTSLSSAEGRASSQPWLKHAEIDALKSQIEDIQTECRSMNCSSQGKSCCRRLSPWKICLAY